MSRDFEDEFYRKYRCTLRHAITYLFRRALENTKNLHDAADLAQDALVKLITTDPVKPVKSWESYMYRVVKHLYIDKFVRSRSRQLLLVPEPPEGSTNDSGPEEQVMSEDFIRSFWKAVDTLDEIYQEVVRLRVCHFTLSPQWEPSEIAVILGIPVSTVRGRLYEAKRILRGRFNLGDGEDS